MSVEDWARREAATRYPSEHFYGQHDERDAAIGGMQAGIAHAFFALLSDEAVEAAAVEASGHVDLFDRDAERRDTGGIRCSCRQWRAGPNENGVRPSKAWHQHVQRAAFQAAVAAVTEGDTE